MNSTPFDLGLRVVGRTAAGRRVVNHAVAFAAYAACDPRADVERESYLSFFVFGPDLDEYFRRDGSEAGYSGPCAAPWLWWDIDRPDVTD